MKKILFVFLFLHISLLCFSQTQEDIAFQKLKTFSSSISPYYKCNYNKFNHTLKIDAYIIDILYSKVEYTIDAGQHYVFIRCEKDPEKVAKNDPPVFGTDIPQTTVLDKDCITLLDGKTIGGVKLFLPTEKDCYTFINLIAELRNAMKTK